MPKVPNAGKVAKRQIASPDIGSKKLLTCIFTLLTMHPSNKLQLFRHFRPPQPKNLHLFRRPLSRRPVMGTPRGQMSLEREYVAATEASQIIASA